jgi:hypothetical protein
MTTVTRYIYWHSDMIFDLYTEYIWKVRTNSGSEFFTAKENRKFIWTRVLFELQPWNDCKKKGLSSLMHLQEVLKMSSVRFNTCLDTSYHWPSNTFKDVGGVAGSVTAVHNALLKSFYVINRKWINKGFQVYPNIETQRIQVRWAWGPHSGPSSTYPSVTVRDVQDASGDNSKMCWRTIMHEKRAFSDRHWYII